ncbi:MAG TPA: hypothetical protein VN038_01305 [Dyadobacter sp.]|nr:hypothetical protein [Dyadobacter sp.]
MKSKISFSGSIAFISAIAQFAATLPHGEEGETEESEQGHATLSSQPFVVTHSDGSVGAPHQFETDANGLIIVPPQKQREKADYKAHRIAAEKARAEQEKQISAGASPAVDIPGGANNVAQQLVPQAPTEPNAFANYAIQQQHQFAQQPVQQAPSFPQQPTGFPAAAPAQTAAGFPASNPAQAPVATNGQAWLNPATINQQVPTINDFNTLIQPLVVHERPRQILGEWLAHKQLQNFEQIADQPAVLAEAIQVATQIRDGILK